MGPEAAKPLTEAAASQLPFLLPGLRRPPVRPPYPVPPPEPPPPQLALPGRSALALPPARPGQLAIEQGAIPMGPKAPIAPKPIPEGAEPFKGLPSERLRARLERNRLRLAQEAKKAPPGPSAPPPPKEPPPADPVPRPPAPPVPSAPPAAVEPVPPRFERTAIGEQGVVPGAPKRALPSQALKARTPQADVRDTALFGQERAAARGVQGEMVDPQRAAVQEWLTDQIGSQATMALVQAKSALTIPPAVRKRLEGLGITPKDAWDVTHAEVPGVDTMKRLVGLSTSEGRALPPAGTAGTAPKVVQSRPGAFQRKGDFEQGIPTLSDPDDVYQLVTSRGKLKITEDLTGELRDVSAFFKSKKGMSLDWMAESIADEYPGLGTREAVKEKLLDTLRQYKTLKDAKKAKGARTEVVEAERGAEAPEAGTPESKVWGEIRSEFPPADVRVSPEEWKILEPPRRRAMLEFFRGVVEDESGKLDLAKMGKALHRWRGKFPMETAIIKERPNSPVISEVERWTTGLTDWITAVAESPWWRPVRKLNPEIIKDAEEAAVRDWLGRLPISIRDAMRDPAHTWTPAEVATQQAARQAAMRHFPPEVQAAMRRRETQFLLENQSRRYFGLSDIPEEIGPYLPRISEAESREAVSLSGSGRLGAGRALQTGVGGHAKERVFETYRQGQAGGTEYVDPRNAILLREWVGLKLRATERLFRRLEAEGTLFRDKTQAAAASPTGRPWKVENAPGGEWWTPTEAEAKFLQQNLTESSRGPFGSLVGYGNALLRNPNLVNPAPHVIKNMAMKALLARGPVTPYILARDAVEWARGTNPQLLRDFNEAMPFASTGRISAEVLGRELRAGTIGEGVKRALRVLGSVNRPSQKVIFEWADPAMRYAMYKHYRMKGMGVYEAGNHAWVDLIRYGTRSVATDTWKSIPLNFFVPWRFGTIVSLLKQAKNHPVRTALLLGAVDYLREMRYRADGKWTHLPFDYAEKPIATLLESGKIEDVVSVLGTTALFGPGGEFSVKQLRDALNAVSGQPNSLEWRRLQNAFWGLAQVYNLPEEYAKGDYAGMLATILLGEHNAYSYQPRRLMSGLPESLPGMQKSPAVREAERLQQRKQELFERSQARRAEHPRKSIEDRLRQSGYLR